jgi:hypothetical protein
MRKLILRRLCAGVAVGWASTNSHRRRSVQATPGCELKTVVDDMQENETLEILYRARESLTAGAFDFHDWKHCTCGHLFIAAEGACANERSEVRMPRPGTAYAAAVVAVAQTLSGNASRFSLSGRRWYERRSSPAFLAARWISDDTMRRGRRRRGRVRRADAIAVIDEAIVRLEALVQERARRTAVDVHERQLPA